MKERGIFNCEHSETKRNSYIFLDEDGKNYYICERIMSGQAYILPVSDKLVVSTIRKYGLKVRVWKQTFTA